jgi:internalin A
LARNDASDPTSEAKRRFAAVAKAGSTELDLSGLDLTTLPEAIGQPTQLRTLDLHDNRLTALPEAIGRLTQLRTLNLCDNRLTPYPRQSGSSPNWSTSTSSSMN